MSRVVWNSFAEAGAKNGRYILEVLDISYVLDWRPVFRSHEFDAVLRRGRKESGTWKIVDSYAGYGDIDETSNR